MGRRYPTIKPKEAIRALKKAGFYIHNQRGSHVQLKHPDKPGKITVPFHNKDLKAKVLKTIVEKQAGLTLGEFIELLKK